jgi:hypothetical protein
MGKARWIWYPGDFEIWIGNRFNNRRTERGAMFPPFWKQDSHWPTVVFATTVKLEEPETVTIVSEGRFSLAVDGALQTHFDIPAGEHRLSVKVWNQVSPPTILVSGKTVNSDSTWLVTYEDKIWIDETGQAHGSGIYVPAASWWFDSPATPPSHYRLPTTPMRPVSREFISAGKTLYDFGRETFGYLHFKGLHGPGGFSIYYGESREEALDAKHCETLDTLQPCGKAEGKVASKAMRYVCVERSGRADFDELTLDHEYAPFDKGRSGSFSCNDDELNDIWKVSAYTLELTTREFFCDGIKRDRWVWSGDAIQSYLMNYYLHFDTECVKRTVRLLRGKDPVTAHVNTIMDYTFYWFISIADYYLYTGDTAFVSEMWPKMVTLMDYVLSRTNGNGMADGKPDDWIFVDWVDFPMHKRGSLSFEQILFWKALKTMAHFSVGCGSAAAHLPDYDSLADHIRQKTNGSLWNPDQHTYLHAIEDGTLNRQVTKFPNIFAILYDFVDEEEKPLIAEHVLLNPTVPPITTPYMRFYELEALCTMDMQTEVLRQMKNYWGGMLRLGATTFWEKYNPEEKGTEQLAMYGRPYGKSLCHSWGASPIYIIGKHFLGVRPTKPGYSEYEVRPSLGGLQWMKGDVPTPYGLIHVEMTAEEVRVKSDGGQGTLVVDGEKTALPPEELVVVRRECH